MPTASSTLEATEVYRSFDDPESIIHPSHVRLPENSRRGFARYLNKKIAENEREMTKYKQLTQTPQGSALETFDPLRSSRAAYSAETKLTTAGKFVRRANSDEDGSSHSSEESLVPAVGGAYTNWGMARKYCGLAKNYRSNLELLKTGCARREVYQDYLNSDYARSLVLGITDSIMTAAESAGKALRGE
ncbi:hypothetical protein L204_104740 [Cryptococcus depauperatus]